MRIFKKPNTKGVAKVKAVLAAEINDLLKDPVLDDIELAERYLKLFGYLTLIDDKAPAYEELDKIDNEFCQIKRQMQYVNKQKAE